MRFGAAQVKVFGTRDGSYSQVTDRENYDSQVTLTDYEAELAVGHFGRNSIHIGNVTSDRAASAKQFRLYPDGEYVTLNLVFPKPGSQELRLYLAEGRGFKPDGGSIWFMYLLDDELWIGSLGEPEWRSLMSDLRLDEADVVYQESIHDPALIRTSVLAARDVYQRDRRVAIEAMEISGYACCVDADHYTFTSKASGQPYVEAHHLIPMSVQSEFSVPLDVVENVYCLCPTCHSAVHHAEDSLVREIVEGLASQRQVLEKFGIMCNELLGYYSVEDID
jgi:hypothetical protein